jgi:hypothetical protein
MTWTGTKSSTIAQPLTTTTMMLIRFLTGIGALMVEDEVHQEAQEHRQTYRTLPRTATHLS